MFQAYEVGVKLLMYRVGLALKIGAVRIAGELLKSASMLVPQLGYSYLNTPTFYRPKIEDRTT